MFKLKTWIALTLMLLASTLPAQQAQASELAKLGKLLVTGKRAPATAAESKPAPAPASPERSSPRGDSVERATTQAAPLRILPELPPLDIGTELLEPRSEGAQPGRATPSDQRVGRSPAHPSQA